MPTIKDLPLALVAADGDLLPVSQGGLVRRVSRAQFLAGMQPALAIQSGALFGRSSAGVGGAERIGVGPNLRLVDGTLSAASPFSVAGLPGGVAPGLGDLVGVAQGGQDVALPYGAFMAGLAGVPGINLSAQVAQVPGGVARSLADWAADAMPAEAFGAVGDGHADDTAALGRAVASGRPVRLGPRTYILRGQWSISQAATLIGVPGQTVLLRVAGDSPAAGAFVNIDGPAFTAMGVTFDAGQVPGESWGVLVTPRCTQTLFDACVFQGARGSSLGSGLVIQGRDNLSGPSSRHRVIGCEARNNQVHGIWVQAASGALVEGCSAHDNGAYGICLDFNDPAFQQTVRHGRVLGCEAWGNARGISVGNFNETNAEPPRWGHAHPDAVAMVVAGNSCHDNSSYGIAMAGRALSVIGNDVSGNGNGLLVNAAQSRIAGNVVSGPGSLGPTYFGIDAGGCVDCDVSGNLVQGCSVGINPGGSRGVRVADNQLLGNGWGVTAYNVETDGRSLADGGQNFGIACEGLTIEGNRIVLQGGSGGGVYLLDAPQGVVVARNAFFGGDGSSPSQALWAHTDSVTVRDNTWNNQARMICNPVNLGLIQQVQVPDMLDGAMVTSAGLGVQSLVGMHQATVAGQVGFVRLQAGGNGYTQASVSIIGAGSGAQAIAHIRDGAVLGIALVSAGSGYEAGAGGAGAGATVVITGDGQGAVATATVGLRVTDERRVRLHCNCAVRFQRVGSAPFQDNWTGTDILVPAATAVDWVGTWGGWQALAFAPADYLAPTGDGSLVLRTANGARGDLTLRPSGPGRLRIGSDNEPWGFVSTLGRGSPEGVVSAPPGSDYRNLDGGAGATLWLKRSGAGAIGWAAIG